MDNALNQAPSWQLTPRQLCDIELILNNGFAPLDGFMSQADYESVLTNIRLANNTVWPMPIVLDVNASFAKSIQVNQTICLRNPEGTIIALMTVSDIWKPNKTAEATAVLGSNDEAHPAIHYLHHQAGEYYVGGKLKKMQLPLHYDFSELRKTPTELKNVFETLGWKKIVAFQTRNPMHRAHQELTIRAAKENHANLLIQPVVGMTKPGDIDHYTRVRCYKKMLERYPTDSTMLSLLPLAMRMGGPREALWHAIIRKNYGATHFIVGRDHAGPGNNSEGNPFYGPYDAQTLVKHYEDEIGIKMVPFQEMVYIKERSHYVPINQAEKNETVLKISGTEFRRRLRENLDIPEWFSYSEIILELKKSYPPRTEQGFTLFFTGLSGAGKSTLANALLAKLMEIGTKPITLLDGDIVRQHLSSELTFSKEHRDLNIKRIGFVAAEITKSRGIAICAPIAPYTAIRRYVRKQIESVGGFLEIFVSTPLEICKKRDVKGLYAKAEAGIIKNFTGISDPYETPKNPELTIDTSLTTVESAVEQILSKLQTLGYLPTTTKQPETEYA